MSTDRSLPLLLLLPAYVTTEVSLTALWLSSNQTELVIDIE